MATASNESSTVSEGPTVQQLTKNEHVVVGAIDFGTTYTGYAFSLADDRDKIMMKSSTKVPTVILLSPEKKFVAFGYNAQDKYCDLVEDGEAEGYYYFETFKMKLYETKNLSRDTTIPDKNGKFLKAMDVFAMSIKHLKEEMELDFKKGCAGVHGDGEIFWVITVPAIWSDSAKQFMREAAIQAGMNSNQIKLALEPEAAAIYCNSFKMVKHGRFDGTVEIAHFPVGHQYIIADLGGGTADISVHEILPQGNLKEIYRTDGGPFGGNLINQAYVDFLITIFGKDVLEKFSEKHMNYIIEMQKEFEQKKRSFENAKQETHRLKVHPSEIRDILKEAGIKTFENIKEEVKEKYGTDVQFKGDKIQITPNILKLFFDKVADEIVSFIRKMRSNDDKLNLVNTLLMVGGVSESTYIQTVIKEKVQGLRVIIPSEPSLAVLKGAVMMGYTTGSITERVARYTYGFKVAKLFHDGKDPEKFKQKRGDDWLCDSVFDKLIERGQVLKYGDKFKSISNHRCRELLDTVMVLSTPLYKSEDLNPDYADEEYGCYEIAKIVAEPPPTGWPFFSIFVDNVIVGESEFTVQSHMLNTGETLETKIDFLK